MLAPETEGLTLRLLNLEHAKDSESVFALDQDPQVMRYINGGDPTSRKDLTRIKERVAAFTRPEKGWGLWGIFEKESGDFQG